MNEKLFEMLDERLSRMEDRMDAKLDKIIEQHSDHKTRLTHLESQAGFVKWGLGVVGTLCLAILGWALDRVK